MPNIEHFIMAASPKGIGFPLAALADLIEYPTQSSILRASGLKVRVLTRPRNGALDIAVMHFLPEDKDGAVDFACRVPNGPAFDEPPKAVLQFVVGRFGVPLVKTGLPKLFWDEIFEASSAEAFDLRKLHAPCTDAIRIAMCAKESANTVMVPFGFMFDISRYLAWLDSARS